jgi:two-component system KDP operon response regulator KdpE
MNSGKTILVVDDEPQVVQLIKMNLELEGFHVITATNGYEAMEKAIKDMPDLVILDIMMPGIDGFEALKKIREVSSTPVIFLTVKGTELDRVRGLDLGADDYITKPFSPRELVSRIKAVLRRTEVKVPITKSQIKVDDELTIDFEQHKVIVRGQEIKLRPTEYRLLYQLVSNAGQVLPHETLLSRVWGPEYRDEEHYVRLYITYLRQKIEKDTKNPKYILSERGFGYKFKEFSQS